MQVQMRNKNRSEIDQIHNLIGGFRGANYRDHKTAKMPNTSGEAKDQPSLSRKRSGPPPSGYKQAGDESEYRTSDKIKRVQKKLASKSFNNAGRIVTTKPARVFNDRFYYHFSSLQ